MSLELVLGPRRSGKSRLAEERARALGVSTYVATALASAVGEERLRAHQERRRGRFVTFEPRQPEEVVAFVEASPSGILLDGLGLWVGWQLANGLPVAAEALVGALARRRAPTLVVSDEVGWSVHPTSSLAARFVDMLGELNQQLAERAQRVSLVVAGIELVLKESR